MLAKVAATLDVISGGRAVLGIGAGWDADEHTRFGLPFPSIAERVSRLEDGVRICRAMLDECPASYQGRHRSIDRAVNMPRSVSDRIPILVGGQSSRTLRVVAKYSDACNPIGDGGLIRSTFALLDQLCEELGRDPAEIARPAGVLFHRFEDLDARVEEAFASGCDGVILMPWQLSPSPDEIVRTGEGLLVRFG
jgi:alkanesulfonate monooxygenase SsuD/methylene tetrahydromethanopterin reductase-like flavin-dependent oxidoreductase (luciferase family)